METCQVHEGRLSTAVHYYTHTSIPRQTVVVVAEAPVGTYAYYEAINGLMQSTPIRCVDMPREPATAIPSQKAVARVRNSLTLLTDLTDKVPRLTTRQEMGAPSAQNLGLDYSQMAMEISGWDGFWMLMGNRKLKALIEGKSDRNDLDRREHLRHLLYGLQRVDNPHEQDAAVAKAARFVENAWHFINELNNRTTTPDITLVMRLEHFRALSRHLRGNGYQLQKATMLPTSIDIQAI